MLLAVSLTESPVNESAASNALLVGLIRYLICLLFLASREYLCKELIREQALLSQTTYPLFMVLSNLHLQTQTWCSHFHFLTSRSIMHSKKEGGRDVDYY